MRLSIIPPSQKSITIDSVPPLISNQIYQFSHYLSVTLVFSRNPHYVKCNIITQMFQLKRLCDILISARAFDLRSVIQQTKGTRGSRGMSLKQIRWRLFVNLISPNRDNLLAATLTSWELTCSNSALIEWEW